MMIEAQTSDFSRHAHGRLCQRCIPEADVEYILCEGERVRDVGDGAVEISIAREQWAELTLMGLETTRLERLKRIIVVVANDGTIITAMKESHFARRSRGPTRLSCRERAVRAVRRKRGRISSWRNWR